MGQNRDAPAYQEYAAAMMARTEYRLMSLQERGLLYSLRLECWVNRRVPSDPIILSRILGFELNDIRAALPQVMEFFSVENKMIVCPELDDYRTHLEDIKLKQSLGGRRGATTTNGKNRLLQNSTNKSEAGVTRGTRRPLDQSSSHKLSQPQFVENDDDCDAYKDWMRSSPEKGNG